MAITEYYVSAAGGGAHDGTTEADAWTLSEAITANNALGAGGAAGRRYNVKGAHTARGASDTISVGGTATSPAIWRGYNSAIGDLDTGTRDAYGALDTTNFPDIGYSATFKITLSASHIVLANIDFSGARSGEIITASGGNHVYVNCRATNTSTNAAATCITASATARYINSDLVGGASGGAACLDITSGVQTIIGCRINGPAVGIRATQSLLVNVIGTTIYGCTDGVSTTNAGASLLISFCTIYGCSGDGIDIISTSASVQHFVYGSSITDNGGYGINFNGGTAGAYCSLSGNRFRDNTSGNINGFADWVSGTDFRNITTDAGGASTDYVDAATNKDFRLISTAAGYRQGFAHNANIGACGDNVTAGGGGTLAAAWVGT